MKSATLFVGALAAVALAQPHRHQHAELHKKHEIQKRASTVVWVTDWKYVTETIPVTETIWVSSGFVAPATTSSPPAKTSGTPANFFETPSAQAVPPPAPKSSSVYVPPPAPPAPTYVAPTTTSQAAPVVNPPPSEAPPSPTPVVVETPTYVAPVESSSPEPQVYTPPAPVYTPPPAPVYSPPPPPAASPAAPPSGYSGQCSTGSPCKGDITYYDAGLGACGWTNTASEAVVALPHGLMGTQSNGNPYCGKYITVNYGGKSVVAKVVDKCMGCEGMSIDLSNGAFDVLAAESIGRTQAEWWFN